MNEILAEAFRHGAWATKTLIAACQGLSREQLHRPARGFGSVLATLNHVVSSDAGYATILTGVRAPWATEGSETDDLGLVAARVEETAGLWARFLAGPLDTERRLLLDGGTYECGVGVVLAQALHHGAVHREQIRAALPDLGVEPPDLQPWAYALAAGSARWRHQDG